MEVNLQNVSIGYSNQNPLVSGINLHLKIGEIAIVSGENGIGKTTLLKTLAGFQKILSGECNFIEKSKIGYAGSESLGLFPNMTGAEILNFFEVVNLSYLKPEAKSLSLYSEIQNRKYHEMSSGMKQLLKLFITSLENKKLIIWDEPLKSLADKAKSEIIEYADRISKEKIMIVTEHSFRDWEHVSSQKFLIKDKAWIKS